MKTSILLILLLMISWGELPALAGPSGPGRTPRAIPADAFRIHSGGPVANRHTQTDTLYLIGGPDRLDGRFSDENGAPSWNGWTSVDRTKPENHWNVSTFNAADLDPATPDNHAWWCGRVFLEDCHSGDYHGYGNNWEENLDWQGTVADNTQAVEVTVSGIRNLDIEPGHDFLFLFWESARFDWVQVTQLSGTALAQPFNFSFQVEPEDYVGWNADQVHLRWEFTSDLTGSDADCGYVTLGAVQLDLMEVRFDGVLQGEVEDCEDGPPYQWWRAIDYTGVVGNFGQVWSALDDLDPCRGDGSPLVAFIDDGEVVPGTGGYLCTTWCYGPDGYIVNPEGGLAGPDHYLHNEIWSPVIEWPAGDYDGAGLDFDVYTHEPLDFDSPGIFWTAAFRSIDTGDPEQISAATWQEPYVVVYGDRFWERFPDNEVATYLVQGATHVQIAFTILELGWYWGYFGTDGTPAPYFDNIAFYAFEKGGPTLSAWAFDLACDAFPAIGTYDFDDPAANNVRFDSLGEDSLKVEIIPLREGAVLERPRIHYKLFGNPLFDEYRTSGLPAEGWVYGDTTFNSQGLPIPDLYQFDLPDSGFLFPGDLLHYYIAADDNAGGELRTSILPVDTTGFSSVEEYPNFDLTFTVHALPTFQTFAPDGHPPLLFLKDNDFPESADEWFYALRNLGFRRSDDYDLFFSHWPNAGSGLGGAATALQLYGYRSILSAGDLSMGEVTVLALDDWLLQGAPVTNPRNLLLTGSDLASGLQEAGGNSDLFLTDWMSVDVLSDDLRPLISNQASPVVEVLPGNGVINQVTDWIAYGGCPRLSRFDAVVPIGNGEALAEFTAPDCIGGGYPYAAVTYHHRDDYNATVISMPYGMQNIFTGGCPGRPLPHPVADRTILLQDILVNFGLTGGSFATAAPLSTQSFSIKCAPNPFNPRTVIEYFMPRDGELSLQIFNLRGELVRDLVSGPVPAGRGSVVWNGRDARDSACASGAYFYRARALGETSVGKIMLLK